MSGHGVRLMSPREALMEGRRLNNTLVGKLFWMWWDNVEAWRRPFLCKASGSLWTTPQGSEFRST